MNKLTTQLWGTMSLILLIIMWLFYLLGEQHGQQQFSWAAAYMLRADGTCVRTADEQAWVKTLIEKANVVATCAEPLDPQSCERELGSIIMQLSASGISYQSGMKVGW